MNHPEHDIQCQIVTTLRLMGIYLFSVPNDMMGNAKPWKMLRYKMAGLWPGVPDLVLISRDGRVHFMEVKSESGVLSDYQKRFKALCTLNSWPYAVVRSVDEAIAAVKGWQLP